MVVENSLSRDQQSIRDEYNQIFEKSPIRDEDRAYLWQAQLTRKLHPQAKAILDVACGAGFFPEKLKQVFPTGTKICGTDLSDVALKLARERCPDLEFFHAPSEALPFKNETFDVLTCLGSLEHFLDIPAALTEMKRVMRPNGLMVVMVPNIMWYKDVLAVLFTKSRKVRNQTHERFSIYGEWVDLFTSCSLKLHDSYKYNGIAKASWKQALKDMLIPERFSYHFIYILKK